MSIYSGGDREVTREVTRERSLHSIDLNKVIKINFG